MTPEDFKNWRAHCGFKSQRIAAEALGLSVGTIENYEPGVRRDGNPAPIPYTVALACSALAMNLPPWPAKLGS
ncbi:helix-turn-helix domain-containing protein [Amorphus orientalis]|uniref:DNA-binding XRE family transcriptional regulator n=1 Tax=Amorphus orientalis TaxID=649198 RepID=A0AAE4AT08_9HYPH|nr:XRE family transcriptional regulator [Amorphus orientalis]MDQ0315570.1 DNA-binding XRE family transcriptional regulator [Amorphus orientalis]